MILIVNKSDAKGGAAVASFRLMEALRSCGEDARMLVAEKLTDSPYVEMAAPGWRLKGDFIAERLRIFAENRFDRSTLFKIDTAYTGVDISLHPLVEAADVIILNWINQGFLSLKDISQLLAAGKIILWTQHDMWCMTGVCHHAGECRRYEKGGECGECPLLESVDTPMSRLFGSPAGPDDISHKTFLRKKSLYSQHNITFVTVSEWLAEKARGSALLCNQDVRVIGNPFFIDDALDRPVRSDDEIRIVFGAARLDDDIKGLPFLLETLVLLRERRGDIADRVRLITYGGIRDAERLANLPVRHTHLGMVPVSRIPTIFSEGDIVLSLSYFETFGYTLLEGQAYGSIPVAFDSGGQRDIIDHRKTGYLCRPYETDDVVAGIEWCVHRLAENADAIRAAMRESAESRFSYHAVARAYLDIIKEKKDGIMSRL